ncbi:MAG: 4-(cytidine 5'-diphospho)-2-C-methyl-D-erythritol kinase [Cyanobacteria bacterium P01_H01_bin.74]
MNVRALQSNGLHEIYSVIQAVSLWDQLDIVPNFSAEPGRIRLFCDSPALQGETQDNLIVKAYQLFWLTVGQQPVSLDVTLHKRIPVQAGLGGGSSNAAAMLVALNHLSFAGLSTHALQAMAAKLGADVPFFITGGLAVASGTGRTIEPLPPKMVPVYPIVIIKPKTIGSNTAQAYQKFRDLNDYESRSADHLLLALQKNAKSHRPICPEDYLMNDFETVIFPDFPVLRQIKDALQELGILKPMLSGSGSAMFAFVPNYTDALKQAIAQTFSQKDFDTFWVKPVEASVVQA